MSVASLPAALTLLRRLQDASGGAAEAFEFMPRSHMEGYLRLNPEKSLPMDEVGEVNILTELGATSKLLARPSDDGRPLIEGLLEEILTALA